MWGTPGTSRTRKITGAWFLMVSEWNPRKEVPHSSNFQGDTISRETLFAARLKAVRLKAARRKAARLKAALVFPDKGKPYRGECASTNTRLIAVLEMAAAF